MGDTQRPTLSRDLIVTTAVRLADDAGIAQLSMRRLGAELGVEAMSLYHHLRDKSALLDAMVDLVFAQIEDPEGPDWRDGLARRAASQRATLNRHPWALELVESRATPGPATLRHHDAVLGYLRSAGFGVRAAGHVYSLVDAYVYGFALQERQLPFDSTDAPDVARAMLDANPMADLPHLSEFTREVVVHGYDYTAEFSVGLDVLLDAVARLRTSADDVFDRLDAKYAQTAEHENPT
ncbi:MAG: TetR/AcrR family transcriptional regulator [Micrococcales bacterium]|nr:TetR/AcrR family transcriptional regulator [Micrococcales bacterium]